MRLLTWNCNGANYARLAPTLARYGADIAVLSEVLEFRNLDPATATAVWSGPGVAAGRRKKGVGVVVREGLMVTQAEVTEDPSAILARVEGLGGPLDVLGIWTHLPYPESALAGLARLPGRGGPTPFVVAGDFNDNVYPSWLKPKAKDFRTVLRVVEDELKLVSAYHAFHGARFATEEHPTIYWRRKKEQPYHIDYVFVPQAWAPRIMAVRVPSYEQLTDLSDHRPVVVDLEDT